MRGDLQFHFRYALYRQADNRVAAPSIRIDDKTRRQAASESWDIDNIGSPVTFTVHICRHHILRIVSHINHIAVNKREKSELAFEPVDSVILVVHLHLDAFGRHLFGDILRCRFVHLIADAHIRKGLQHQLHHRIACRIQTIHQPHRIANIFKNNLMILLVGHIYFTDTTRMGSSLDLKILTKSAAATTQQNNEYCCHSQQHDDCRYN